MSSSGETTPPPSSSTPEPPSSSTQPPSSSQPPPSSSQPPSSQNPGQSSSQPPPSGGQSSSTEQSAPPSSTSTFTVTTTDSSGFTYTTVSVSGALPSTTPGPTSDGAQTGAIVGGVIGGIAALFLLALLIFLLRRRNRNKHQFEDGIFDPDHTIQRPVSQAVNPALEIASDLPPGAARVTPYSYTPDPNNPAYDHGPEMRQSGYEDSVAPSSGAPSDYPLFPNPHPHGQAAYGGHGGHGGGIPAALLAGPAAASVARSHTTASSGYPPSPYGGSGPSYGPLSVSDYDRSSHAPSSPTRTTYSMAPSNAPGPAMAAGAAAAPMNPRSAKEREAFANSHARMYGNGAAGSHAGLSVVNPGSPTDEMPRNTTPVVVHQDGGRVPEPRNDDPSEIPPTYDSIPSDR